MILFWINRLVVPEVPGFFGVDPHPYWLGILLFGFRYGAFSGLLSGLISAALYLGSAWFYLERYLFEDLSFYLLPSFFITIGSLIGAVSGRYRQRFENVEEDCNRLLKVIDGFKEEVRTLQEINDGLEKKIVTRMATLVTLYEGARRMEADQVEDLYPSILQFIAKTLEADEAALYLRTSEGWTLQESLGWKDYEKRPKFLGYHEGMTGVAGSRGKVVSIRDFIKSSDPQLLGDALVAGPLRLGEEGEVLAVVSIQNLPFLNFNSATLNLFNFLLNWASRALKRAYQMKDLQSHDILDSEYPTYSNRYFQVRGEQEFLRSRTYYLPLTVGLIQVDGSDIQSTAKRKKLLLALSECLKGSLREMDILARFSEEKFPFAFLLATTSQAQAEEIRKKTIRELANLGEEIAGCVHISLASFTPQTRSWLDLLDQARKET